MSRGAGPRGKGSTWSAVFGGIHMYTGEHIFRRIRTVAVLLSFHIAMLWSGDNTALTSEEGPFSAHDTTRYGFSLSVSILVSLSRTRKDLVPILFQVRCCGTDRNEALLALHVCAPQPHSTKPTLFG